MLVMLIMTGAPATIGIGILYADPMQPMFTNSFCRLMVSSMPPTPHWFIPDKVFIWDWTWSAFRSKFLWTEKPMFTMFLLPYGLLYAPTPVEQQAKFFIWDWIGLGGACLPACLQAESLTQCLPTASLLPNGFLYAPTAHQSLAAAAMPGAGNVGSPLCLLLRLSTVQCAHKILRIFY